MVLNFDEAITKNLAEAEKIANRDTTLIRQLYRDSRDMLHKDHKFDKAKNKIKEGLRKHIKDLLDVGDEDAKRELDKIYKDLKDMGTVEIALFHYFIRSIFEILKEEKGVVDQLPEVKAFLREMTIEEQKFLTLANDLGRALQSIAHNG